MKLQEIIVRVEHEKLKLLGRRGDGVIVNGPGFVMLVLPGVHHLLGSPQDLSQRGLRDRVLLA